MPICGVVLHPSSLPGFRRVLIAAYFYVRLIPQDLHALQSVGPVGFADRKGGFHTKADPLGPLDFTVGFADL
jgi:hypothetical protein